MGSLEAGFGRATMWGTYKTRHRLADDLDVRTLAVRSGSTTAVIAVADSGLLWQRTCLDIRARLARELNLPAENIGVFCTQNHSTEYGDDPKLYDLDLLGQRFVEAAKAAVAALQPAQVARVATTPQPRLSNWRRVHPEGFGAFTFWYGYLVDGNGSDVSHLLKKTYVELRNGEAFQVRCQTLETGAPEEFEVKGSEIDVPTPYYLDPAPDPLLQGLFFRTPAGEPIGALARFATHPATANRVGANYHSGDYPAYVRRRLQETFGGGAVFMTGPCGDSCPHIGIKSLDLAKSLGTKLADHALAQLSSAQWETDASVAVTSPMIALPIRADYPENNVEATDEYRLLGYRIKELAKSGAPLTQIKPLTDRYEFLYDVGTGAFHSWTGLDTDSLKGTSVQHPIFVLRIGSSVIAGLPGEAFGGYSARLRRETLGDALITAEEANGYLVYFPTAKEFPLGGYESNACMFAPECEDIQVHAVKNALRTLGL